MSSMDTNDERSPGDRVPPRSVGWFFVIGSPLFVLLVTIWYWDDGLASILLNSWYMLVTFTFGVVILRSKRRGGES